jgi:glyoxylase-like metal-dependent hydrolase (beta-lactamase superfamily II)
VHFAAHALFPVADLRLKEGDTVQVGKLNLRVLETPGHTADSLSFVLGNDVFCGDALFAGSVGGTNSREEYATLIQSIRSQLLPLGDDMVLHPGHGPATTVLIERLFNPFLMA